MRKTAAASNASRASTFSTSEYADSGESVYTDEYQQLVYRENELLSQYRSLAADTGIELDGREWTLEEYFTQEDADI